MAIIFQIRKKTGNVWNHYKVLEDKNYGSSQLTISWNGDRVEVTEIQGTDFARYDISEVAVYDDTSAGTEETFLTPLAMAQRLKELLYTGFKQASGSGAVDSVVAGSGISVDSTDPANPVVSTTGGGSGTVTSVAVSGSDGIEVDSGSPITTSGTIALGVNKTTMLTTLNVEDGADVTDADNIEDAITGVSADTITDTSIVPFVKAATLVKITWANIKATLKTYFDTLYVVVADFLEEKMPGTAAESLTVSGATNISLSSAADMYLKLTGNATITFTDTPVEGYSIVRTYSVESDSTETLGISNSTDEFGTYAADGTINEVVVKASNYSTEGLIIRVFFSQPN